MELVTVPEGNGGHAMIGICYLTGEEAGIVAENIEKAEQGICDMTVFSGRKHYIEKIK